MASGFCVPSSEKSCSLLAWVSSDNGPSADCLHPTSYGCGVIASRRRLPDFSHLIPRYQTSSTLSKDDILSFHIGPFTAEPGEAGPENKAQ